MRSALFVPLLCCAGFLQSQDVPVSYDSIEVYSMSLQTSTRFDYSPSYLISSVDSLVFSGANVASRFKVVFATNRVADISSQLSKLLQVPDSSVRRILDCRIAVRILDTGGKEYLIGIDSSKNATINGYSLMTGKRIYRLLRRKIPKLGR